MLHIARQSVDVHFGVRDFLLVKCKLFVAIEMKLKAYEANRLTCMFTLNTIFFSLWLFWWQLKWQSVSIVYWNAIKIQKKNNMQIDI